MQQRPIDHKESRFSAPAAFRKFSRQDLHRCIPDRFEDQVKLFPQRIAVKTDSHTLTYEELNHKANRIARMILAQKGSESQPIALIMETGGLMMAAILGILKARRFFIPLDPSLPPSRARHILSQAHTAFILINNSTLPIAQELREDATRLVNIDEIDNTLSQKNLGLTISPDHLGYIVYTSGSTGQPKGVMQNHRNILHKTMEHTNSFCICYEDRLGLLYSPSFSGAMRDIFSALLNGAGLFPFDLKREGIHRVADWLIQEDISVYNSVATVFRHLVGNMTEKRKFPNLRLIQLGSEPIYASDVDLFKNNFSRNCRFVARYGTSEIAPIRWFSINHETQIPGNIVPAGHAVPDIDVVLLDEHGQEVGDGQIGEITVKSRYLTPGYWAMPELTQSKFSPDSKDPNRTVYRTGDLGYVLPDGCLVPVGRTDSQIKIRGYRIEIAEVEAALFTHQMVKEAAVIVQDDHQKGKHLIAYLVSRTDEQPSPNAIRRYLTETLPHYMIPATFVFLHRLPVTGAGKIDRHAISKLNVEVADLETAYMAPRTPDEEILLKLWQEVLNVETLGINDNFFDLGGHSLLATQIMSRVGEIIGATLPLRLLFEAPTVAGLAAALRQNEDASPTRSLPPIQPLPPGAPVPLSFSQERMWFLYQFAPTSAAYNIPWTFHFPGPINLGALEQAVNEIRRRHAVLRTVFPAREGAPVPRIHPFSPLAVPVKDFQDCPAETRNENVQRFAITETQQPFDMAEGPLMRVTFVRLPAEEVLVLVTLHHIISDGWSAEIFRGELETLYEAFATGHPSPLDELPIQYQDFSAWQRGWLQGEILDAQLTYWTQQLSGAPMVLELPHDRPRGALQTFAGRRHVVKLSRALTVGLTQLTKQEGVTLFMTLLASLSIQLGRYTASDDLLVGVPIANRHFLAVEGLIGTFVNTLVLRTRLEGNPPFLDLLRQVRHTTLEGYAHQDLPFEVLVDALHPPRDLSRSPVFQVMFTVQNVQQVSITGKKNFTRKLSADRQAAQFDLTVNVIESSDHRHIITWRYNSDLFDNATIERMSLQFEHLLEEVVAQPQRRIHDLRLLPNQEQQLLLMDWNKTDRPFPSFQCIHTHFESQVARTPMATAVVCGAEHLSYLELNTRANQLGCYLQEHGVGPNTLVGLCVDRSLDMLVGLLGILKAGGAYVPLDPTYPFERLAFMIDDAQMPVIVTHRRLLEQLQSNQQHGTFSSSSNPTILELDAIKGKEDIPFTSNPVSHVTPQHLMYVIYTSGSTGKPKGVMITHRSVGNFLHVIHEEISLTHKDIFLALTSISFDISVLEIFGPLLVGGCVHLVSRETAMKGTALAHALSQSKATFMQATPVTWQLLLDSDWSGSPGLRALCGGEALSGFLAHELLEKGVTLWNLYGPTEATIWSALHRVSPEDHKVPIGRPIANTQFYVMDAERHLMPVGVPGELYIGGEGLSPGYWRREELTREKFIPHPFSDDPRARLYRTGDRVRYRANGRLEFLSRIDNQVKLRGFRIELGEIETTLTRHPLVQEAAVLLRDDGAGGPHLVGYVRSSPDNPVSLDELRQFLKEHLPDYMVPSAWVELEVFPLTPNGKLDRRALPAPRRLNTTFDDTFADPRGPLEEALVEIWQDVLGIDHLGIHDNFFDLGGHSLLATQITSRIQRTFHVDLPLNHLFMTPTVAGLTEKLEDLLQGGQPIEALEVHPVPRDTNLPLSLAQQRLWFLDQLYPEKQTYFITKTSRLRGQLDFQALKQSFNELVKRHESLRTTFPIIDEQVIQYIESTPHVYLPIIDLREIPEDARETEAHRLITEEVRRPFNLETGPLFRMAVFRLGSEDHILVITVHHIISDGWSMGILCQELSLGYNSFTRREDSPLLNDSPVQYADYAVCQRQWLQGARLEKELTYWKSQLDGVSILTLPTDRPRPPFQTKNGAGLSITLSDYLVKALKTLSKAEGCTLFMTMLAAFQTLLHRFAGQDDIVVGSPIAGRTQKELEGSIGLFINTLVLRTNFSGNPSFREVLRQVRKISLEAYAHQVIPFEELIETLKPERNPSYPPLFQVLFVLQNAPRADLKLSGLSASRFRVNRGRAMFDLALSLSENSGRLTGEVGYNTDLFNQNTISRMFRHFETLLEGIVSNPDQEVWSLPILTETEQHQVLIEWNRSRTISLPDPNIQRLFEQQVEKTPEAIALFFDEQRLSYENLNAKANQLARFLQKQGVGPEVRVGLYLERTPEMVIGLLGILKAGGAYVPLDLAYPEERVAFILRDAQISVLITQSHLHGQFLAHEGVIRVNLDTHAAVIAQEQQINLPQDVAAENLAYIIYTSGSTGIPKGVMISHGSLVNYVDVAKNEFKLEPKDRVLQFASISFDASAEEIYPCLTSGGTLVLRTDTMLGSWKAFLGKCQEWQLTILDLPTAFWHELLASMNAEVLILPSSVRLVIIGGERARPELLAQWNNLVSESVQLVNTYGPTEATIVATKGELVRSTSYDTEPSEVPLGKVIPNVCGYLLDRAGQPVPIGVPGELFLGGVGVARGYVNRTDITAEKFLPDPFSKDPGARLYRTGDRVRYRTNGTLEFLGRVDQQVKVRGFRIELGEIEAVLAQYPSVQEAVVLTQDDATENNERIQDQKPIMKDQNSIKRLVAYVVPAKAQSITVIELRKILSEKLPSYMVPSAFVFLKSLPMTPNGKLNRKALPNFDESRPELENDFAAPQTLLEQILARVWAEALKVDKVGVHDDFFDLGGHSLIAIHVVNRLRAKFKMEIPLRILFDYPTIGGMAEQMTEMPEMEELLWMSDEETQKPAY